MRIRSVQRGEIERLRELRLRALLEAPTAFASSHGEEVDRTIDQWLWWVLPPSVAFVAESEAGWHGLAVGRLDDAAQVADVFSMWVEPSSRGQGLGGSLLEQVVAWAWANGARTVRLGVTDGNGPAAALYRRRGFRPSGQCEPLRSHPDLTCVFMELTRDASNVS